MYIEEKLKALVRVSLGLIIGFSIAIALGALSPIGLIGIINAIAWVYTNPAPLLLSLTILGPIASSAVGLTLAYRARFITVGAEGQVLLGAAITLWFLAYSGLDLDPFAAIPASMLLAGLSAMLLGAIPAVLRIYFNANEILISLMLNYIVLYMINHIVSGPWRVGAFAITRSIDTKYRVGAEVILALSIFISLICWIIFSRTKLGLMIEVYGRAPKAAETYGLDPRVIIYLTAIISSLVAGIGGSLMMLGFQYSLSPMSVTPGYGYMGVLAAWFSGNNPIVALIASWFFSSIFVLGRSLQASGLPIGYVLAIQSIIVLSVLASKRIFLRR
ncbi:MAG: hypothetical protein QXE01_00130 [Sulfolobales archaeon]